MAGGTTPTVPREWRIPPGQTATLFVVVSVLCAWNIYGHPSGPVRTFTIALAVAVFAWAVVGMRMYFAVDDEGVAIRFIGRPSWLPWNEISAVDVVSGVRGALTVRFTRRDGTVVDVPPSLLQPSKPMKKPRAIAHLKMIASQLQERIQA